jgi:transposase
VAVTILAELGDCTRFSSSRQAVRYAGMDYQQAAERLGANRAALAVARKLLKRSYHTLRELGEEALAPA